jgi:hypothetical protein
MARDLFACHRHHFVVDHLFVTQKYDNNHHHYPNENWDFGLPEFPRHSQRTAGNFLQLHATKRFVPFRRPEIHFNKRRNQFLAGEYFAMLLPAARAASDQGGV